MNDLLENILKSKALTSKKDQIASVLQDGRDETLISTIKFAAKLNSQKKLSEQQRNSRDNMVCIIKNAL